jgi:hypothetical protein
MDDRSRMGGQIDALCTKTPTHSTQPFFFAPFCGIQVASADRRDSYPDFGGGSGTKAAYTAALLQWIAPRMPACLSRQPLPSSCGDRIVLASAAAPVDPHSTRNKQQQQDEPPRWTSLFKNAVSRLGLTLHRSRLTPPSALSIKSSPPHIRTMNENDTDKENHTITATTTTTTTTTTKAGASAGTTSTGTNSNSTSYQIPWIEKYRPETLEEMVGNEETLVRLQAIARDGNMPNLILCGPPGTGKVRCSMNNL